jgi:phosphoribosylpyrophosphate synthetase
MGTTGGIKIFSGSSHRTLAQEICHELSCDLGKATNARFSDGEFNFQIEENVRGADCFLIQPTCPPTDAYLMELLVMLDAFGGRRQRGLRRCCRITATADRTRRIDRECRFRQSWWRTF